MYNIYTKLGMLNNTRIFVASVFNSELASNFTNLKLETRQQAGSKQKSMETNDTVQAY